MGGDIATPPGSDTKEDSSLDQDSSQLSSPRLRNGLVFEEIFNASSRRSSATLDLKAERMEDAYRKILQSNDELQIRSKDLEEAKEKILGYTPGAWIESVGAVKLMEYDVPQMTTLLLVGPEGSGKSSLVNRISKVFDGDKFASERTQVSYNSSVGNGTSFLQEYPMPRYSTSFCLYDTRGLPNSWYESYESREMLKHWMKNGVRHGEPVISDSESQSLRTKTMCKDRDNGYRSSKIRKVNFVIFVVNGLSILKSIENDEDGLENYTRMVASSFNCPYLAFKDDKPVVVVTHGDLLSSVERARVRVYLGERLGIPPTTQIFDIPESSDPVTELTIVDMLRYSLERAEKNLPPKRKVHAMSLLPWMLLLIILGIAINIWCVSHHAVQHCAFSSSQAQIQHGASSLSPPVPSSPSPQAHIQHNPSPQDHIYHGPLPKAKHQKKPESWIEWSKIRHLWLDE